jgi:cytoskeleton protein RodZ
MMTETPPTNPNEPKHIPFGTRLQSAREALGLESKDAAAQLRLNENIILMMEKDIFSSDLPVTFIRGYLRSYGKLLQIPEHEIKLAIEPIQPKPIPELVIPPKKQMPLLTSGNYFMQLFTYLIIFTLIGLVGIWWYTHSATATSPSLAENQLSIPVETVSPAIALSAPVKTDAVTASVNLGAKLTESVKPAALPLPPSAITKNTPLANDSDSSADSLDTTDNNTETNSDNAD